MKVGIIGLGYWGPNLVRNFLGTEGVKGIVCFDMLEKRVNRIKQRFPSVEVGRSVEELLERKDIQAIAIATPVSSHFELGMMALKAGKHVLIEKPLAASAEEALALVEYAERNSLTLMVDHTFLYTGAVRKIKEIFESGVLGDILYFDSVRVNLGLFQHDTNVIWDLAPHDLSIMTHLIDDEPVSVSAVGINHFNGVEDMAYITVHFAGTLLAHFHVNWLSPVKVRTILVGGSKHMLVYDDMQPSEKIKVYDKGVDLNSDESVYQTLVQYRMGDMHAPRIDQTEALTVLAGEFVSAIRTGNRTISDGRHGLKVVRILEAANESLKIGGARVEVKDPVPAS